VYSYLGAFNAREDLKSRYGNNALLLYALELRYEIEDIYSVAAEALTDGPQDKKCDLIYLDKDNGFAIIAQSYNKANPNKCDLAPVNKASDLNTAAAWVFKRDTSDIPNQIRDAVCAVQDAIISGDISVVYFWYVHNLSETNNPDVGTELSTVEQTAQKLVDDMLTSGEVRVSVFEVGNEQIEKWYKNLSKRIVIEDKIIVDSITGGFEVAGECWKAYVTAVKGSWLKNLYAIYKQDDLFSGNPRNYLGAGKRKNKINLGIKNSVQDEPKNFWAYNNGLTALVNDYKIEEKSIDGITIINGAQTTGAIGNVDSILEDFWVPIRFIICNNPAIIDKIVNNNNKQNEILPSDLRSNDKQQDRLRKEFEKYSQLYYSGGRRVERRTRSKEVFDPYLVAQSLEAFHYDPVLAYNERKTIWDEDKIYSSIFSDSLCAEHIIFTYSLARAIDNYKAELYKKRDLRTSIEETQLTFLSKRGSKMLLIYSISISFESIISKKITNKWKLRFINNSNFEDLQSLWNILLKTVIPFCKELLPALESGLKSKERSLEVATKLNSTLAAFQATISAQLNKFIKSIIYT